MEFKFWLYLKDSNLSKYNLNAYWNASQFINYFFSEIGSKMRKNCQQNDKIRQKTVTKVTKKKTKIDTGSKTIIVVGT